MATITEDYVSYEVARLLEEKGYDEQTRLCFRGDGKILHNDGSYVGYPGYYPRPTLQMAMKWLREVHKLHIEPHIQSYKNYNGNIYNLYGELLLGFPSESPEQACESAIKYCLENLI